MFGFSREREIQTAPHLTSHTAICAVQNSEPIFFSTTTRLCLKRQPFFSETDQGNLGSPKKSIYQLLSNGVEVFDCSFYSAEEIFCTRISSDRPMVKCARRSSSVHLQTASKKYIALSVKVGSSILFRYILCHSVRCCS